MCRKEIPSGAKICTECNCYQDWRRYFGVSGTILSLFVALFSVLAVALPVIWNTLTPNRSEVQCNLLNWSENTGEVTIIVSNKGNRPAVLKALALESKASGDEPPYTFLAKFSDPVLQPGNYRVLQFQGLSGSIGVATLTPVAVLRQKYDLVLMIFPFAYEAPIVSCKNWRKFQ
jgi:hypothetical protein